jgi:hypothetical protein
MHPCRVLNMIFPLRREITLVNSKYSQNSTHCKRILNKKCKNRGIISAYLTKIHIDLTTKHLNTNNLTLWRNYDSKL